MKLFNVLLTLATTFSLLACGGGNKTTASTTPTTPTTPTTTTPVSLFSSAPSTITMSSGAGATSFSIGGGVPPYAVGTSNAAVATATVSGSTLRIASGSVGSAAILLVDTAGAKLDFVVTVGSTAPTSALRTTAPSAITVGVSGANVFTVAGGEAPYAVSSSNAAVATVGLSGSNLSIVGVGAGTAQVLVLDSVGAQVVVGVTVGSPTPTALYTTAPSALTIANGGVAALYAVAGGTLPYTASSSNDTVVTASMAGGTLSLAGLSAGSVGVDIFDATGAKVSIAVTVSAVAGAALTVLPNGATGNVGDTVTFTLLGGAPGYTLSVSNTSIATVTPNSIATSGSTFSAALLNVGSTVVTVFDTQGQIQSFVLSVGATATQLRLSPSAFIVGENELSVITLNMFGGSPPYRALTSDLVKSSVPSGQISGSTLPVSVGLSGDRCINPVTDATPPEYIVSGTYDVTFTVLDSLGAMATSIMTIKDNGAGLNAGCP